MRQRMAVAASVMNRQRMAVAASVMNRLSMTVFRRSQYINMWK